MDCDASQIIALRLFFRLNVWALSSQDQIDYRIKTSGSVQMDAQFDGAILRSVHSIWIASSLKIEQLNRFESIAARHSTFIQTNTNGTERIHKNMSSAELKTLSQITFEFENDKEAIEWI